MSRRGSENISWEGLDRFLAALPWSELTDVATPYFSGNRGQAAAYLRSLQAEAKLGLELIWDELLPNRRLLEVGAGMGLLAGFLCSCGVQVVALEPGLGGFGISSALAEALSSSSEFAALTRLAEPAAKLKPSLHGEFDLIYSINVLEHIPDLESAVEAMSAVMAKSGLMIHTCPNYAIPYEPHFGIPLFPLAPRMTEIICPKLRSSDLWKSLNFISSQRLKSICARNSLEVSFAPGVMYKTFRRLHSDDAFKGRQNNKLVTACASFLHGSGLISALRYLPGQFGTPIVVNIRRRSS